MEEENRSAEQFYTTPTSLPPKKGSRKWLTIIFVILILGVVGVIATQLFGGKNKQIKSPAPTPTETQQPTEKPTPKITEEVTPTKKASATTSQPTGNPVDKATGLDRSKLSVEVLNGSGTPGVAKKAADLLKSLGYNVVSTGNADNYNFTNTEISARSTKTNFLSLLKKDLSGTYTVETNASPLSATASADAQVIVGK